MRLNQKTGIAVLLIFLGAVILLNKLTGISGFHHLGHQIVSFLFPLAMVGLGFLGLHNGRNLIGWILIVIGGVILLGKLSGVIMIAIAAGLIFYGVKLFRSRSTS